MTLHLIKIPINWLALARFAQRNGDHSTDYAVHSWLKAAFGENTPRPWRVNLEGGLVLGYSEYESVTLLRALQDCDERLAQEVLRGSISHQVVKFRSGEVLRFNVQICPIGRESKTGNEKDLCLIRKNAGVSRETVYSEWTKERLERDGGCRVLEIEMQSFGLVQCLRREQKTGGRRKKVDIKRPNAVMAGSLVVTDPELFMKTIGHGIGRHKAFGCGMVVLECM